MYINFLCKEFLIEDLIKFLIHKVLAVLPPKLRWKQRHSELPLRYTIITAKYQILGIEPKMYWAKEDLKFQGNYLRTLFRDDLPDLKWMVRKVNSPKLHLKNFFFQSGDIQIGNNFVDFFYPEMQRHVRFIAK